MPKILIVDDQRCVRELIAEELTCEGYEVETAGDGESVRTLLRFSRPDLVLLDLYLDGHNGWEVLRDLKRQQPHLPVIILTAYDSFEEDPRLSQADGYVVKSTDFGQLKQEIANALRQQQAAQRQVAAKSYFAQVSKAQRF